MSPGERMPDATASRALGERQGVAADDGGPGTHVGSGPVWAAVAVTLRRSAGHAFTTHRAIVMIQQPPSCYRCQGPTTAGMLIDRDYASRNQARWTPGEPRAGIMAWMGGEVASSKRDEYRVVTYRCTRCGALESFAPDRD